MTYNAPAAAQAALPSPFYFFDEVDQALDVTNAARLAKYMASQAGAQYIAVSHKPQVFERASVLVGVYSLRGASAAVTWAQPSPPAAPAAGHSL